MIFLSHVSIVFGKVKGLFSELILFVEIKFVNLRKIIWGFVLLLVNFVGISSQFLKGHPLKSVKFNFQKVSILPNQYY